MCNRVIRLGISFVISSIVSKIVIRGGFKKVTAKLRLYGYTRVLEYKITGSIISDTVVWFFVIKNLLSLYIKNK